MPNAAPIASSPTGAKKKAAALESAAATAACSGNVFGSISHFIVKKRTRFVPSEQEAKHTFDYEVDEVQDCCNGKPAYEGAHEEFRLVAVR